MLICLNCAGKDQHVALRGGLTEGHERSHRKRGQRMIAREMPTAEANRLVAEAEARRKRTPEEIEAEARRKRTPEEIEAETRERRRAQQKAEEAAALQRRAERKAAESAAHAARVAKRAAEAEVRPAVMVVVDPHAGKIECECGRWVVAEHMAAHQQNPDCLRKRREKRAAVRDQEAWREVVAEASANEAAENYLESLGIPDELPVAAEEPIEEAKVPEVEPLPTPVLPANPAPLVAAKPKKGILARLFGR